jgi:hypothetical protein
MKCLNYIASLGLLGAVAFSVTAGEPIIFDHSARTQTPKFEFGAEKKLDDRTQFPDRKGSSVEAVVAPWQNPMNSGKLDAKQRKALMEALDKKQNWAFQSGEDYLGTADLDGVDTDEDSFLSSDLESKSASLKLAERVFYGNKNKKESLNKRERTKRKNRFKDDKDNLSTDNKKNMTGEELLAQSGGVATPSFYQQQFDSLFQSGQGLNNNTSKDSLGTMSQREVTAASMLGMGNLVPEQYKQGNPSSGRSQSFQNLMDSNFTGISTKTSQKTLGNLSQNGWGGSETSGLLGNLSGVSSNIVPGRELSGGLSSGSLNSSLNSFNSSRALGGTPLDLGNSGFAPSGLGGGGFSPLASPSAAPSVQRPIFFEIPRRAF